MLRYDGDYSIYFVEFKSLNLWSNAIQFINQLPSMFVSLPHIITARKDRNKYETIIEGFSSAGTCWQQTGEHGTYSITDAGTVMMLCARFFPDHEFRVVCVEISQKSNVMAATIGITSAL